ncbi:F0F1 ATP synthase subunit B [Candidatus Saganbacteria bacterium]|nr:F0F1 ATP synthase subunit B [Candidatus Saganbacteria bacterium]
MLEFEPGLIIWTTVSFAILVALLYKLLLPPLLDIIEKREAQIRSSLEEAVKAQANAENMILEYKKKMDEAFKAADQIIEKSKGESQILLKEAEDRAKKEAQSIMDQARSEIEASKNKMLKEIKEVGADLIVQAASRVLGREVKKADNERMIMETIGEAKNI